MATKLERSQLIKSLELDVVIDKITFDLIDTHSVEITGRIFHGNMFRFNFDQSFRLVDKPSEEWLNNLLRAIADDAEELEFSTHREVIMYR